VAGIPVCVYVNAGSVVRIGYTIVKIVYMTCTYKKQVNIYWKMYKM